ncbi:MAG: ECF transporter S component [Anaerolineae bacterium]
MNTYATLWTRTKDYAGLGRFAGALTMALLIPNLGLPQWITGALVNALLLLSVDALGLSQTLVIGMVTPLAAALRGVLPLPLMVMIPFIALGNALFVSLYSAVRPANRWLALAVGALAKFALLYGAVTVLVAHPLRLVLAGASQPVNIPATILHMMSWPQLATALAGGLIAWTVRWAAQRAAR